MRTNFSAVKFAPRAKIGIHVAAALALAAALPAASAQEAKPADKEVGKLDAIVVTAERRSENIKDVPNSVTALKGGALDAINSSGQDIRMLAARIPSLNIESSFGRAFPRFYIRGLGNTDFDLNASQPVSLVYDDVVQENPILKGFPIFDLDQIEVLRGPQGTLFGRNSPAGVIKFDSAKPRRVQEGYLNVSDATHQTTNIEGAYNVPLNNEWAARFSLQAQYRNDWVHNTYAKGPTQNLEGYNDNAGRFQLLYQPNDGFSALFNVHFRDLKGSARLFRANIIKKGTNDLVDGFDPASISIDGSNHQNLTSNGGSMRLKWDFGGFLLHSITGYEHVDAYSRGDIDGGFGASFAPPMGPGFIPFPSESADGMPKHRQVTQEFRLESTAKGSTKWLAGLYYFDEDINIDSFDYNTLAGGAQDGYAQQHQKNKAYAAFGSINQQITDSFSMRAGLRYTNDKKDFTAQRFVSPIGGGATGVLTANPSANDTSWDISATYAVDRDVNLYARVAKGFRAPSIQGRLLFGNTISVAKAETVVSSELGIKADLFNKRGRLNFNVFQYSMKDPQLTAVGGAANFNQLINANKVTGDGFEVDFQALLTDTTLFTLGGSLNNTKIQDSALAIAPCGSGCTVQNPVNPVTGLARIDGNPLPQAPKNVVNWSLRQTFPLQNGEIYLYTDWAYRSSINFFLYKSTEYTGKPLTEGGLRIGYKWNNDKFDVAIYGRNITNQIRVVGGIDFNNLTGFINEPRIWGLQFKAVF